MGTWTGSGSRRIGRSPEGVQRVLMAGTLTLSLNGEMPGEKGILRKVGPWPPPVHTQTLKVGIHESGRIAAGHMTNVADVALRRPFFCFRRDQVPTRAVRSDAG